MKKTSEIYQSLLKQFYANALEKNSYRSIHLKTYEYYRECIEKEYQNSCQKKTGQSNMDSYSLSSKSLRISCFKSKHMETALFFHLFIKMIKERHTMLSSTKIRVNNILKDPSVNSLIRKKITELLTIFDYIENKYSGKCNIDLFYYSAFKECQYEIDNLFESQDNFFRFLQQTNVCMSIISTETGQVQSFGKGVIRLYFTKKADLYVKISLQQFEGLAKKKKSIKVERQIETEVEQENLVDEEFYNNFKKQITSLKNTYLENTQAISKMAKFKEIKTSSKKNQVDGLSRNL